MMRKRFTSLPCGSRLRVPEAVEQEEPPAEVAVQEQETSNGNPIPTSAWSHQQIDAYAELTGISLDKNLTKAEKLEALNRERTETLTETEEK